MYAQHLGSTPQNEPLKGQVANSAGGFSFAVDDWKRLDRFLVLGAEGGSYYASERKLTVENAAVVERCAALDGLLTVARIVQVSDAGRAPKNEPALMALAICAKRGDTKTRQAAFAALPRVARIGTHLFHFAEYVKALGGWGRATTRAFANWYLDMAPERLALQAIKYQQRDGWAHRDILRKAHPKTDDATRNAILNWIVKGWDGVGAVPHEDAVLVKIWAFERAKVTTDRKELIRLISEYGLPHECVPSEAKGDPAIWDAMLPSMGLTALIRNLGKMTSVGLLKPLVTSSRIVIDALSDIEAMKRARIHPLSILVALKTYAQGHGDKGSLKWEPVAPIVDALDAAFYTAFKAVEPTGKRHLLALDVSGSMTWPAAQIAGMGINAREGSAAMALVTANVEQETAFVGFTTGTGTTVHGRNSGGIAQLAISPRQRLDDVIKTIQAMPAGGTDCALPMLWAAENKIPVDVFCVFTDSETWAGNVHPVQALRAYRQKMGIGAKLVVVGMVASEFTIADPTDAGMLDLVGFDSSAPAVLSDFARE